MKKLFILSLLFIGVNSSAIETVEQVDINKYMGKWFEIAMIPNSFQKDCIADTSAEYKLLEDNTVEVTNSCLESNQKMNVTIGNAKVVNAPANSELKVTFVKFFGQWIYQFAGDYHIIELDSDYNWVVVGHPNYEYGWILSRKPYLEKTLLNEIMQKIKAQGYDECQFVTSPQQKGFTDKQSICDL